MNKGVSTFVGVALLIAMTLAVAGIYSGWFMNFIKSTTNTIKQESDTKLVCNNGGISLDNLKYNQTSGILSGTVQNTDIIDLGGLGIEIFFTNSTRNVLSMNTSLVPGEQQSFTSNISTTTYDRIRVKTNCSNVYDEASSTYVSIVS